MGNNLLRMGRYAIFATAFVNASPVMAGSWGGDGTWSSYSWQGYGFDIPTGMSPSPQVFATGTVTEFAQSLPLFEEFGVKPLPVNPTMVPLPVPTACNTVPDGAALDSFLGSNLYPLPLRLANTALRNPWEGKIGECLNRTLATSAVEGRPSGEWFAHQRWDEFAPQGFFQSAQTGARVNGGLRDGAQRHHWTTGEFGPTGLYYHGGSNKLAAVRFHPNMPAENPNSVWTFDGTMPPKLLIARYGEPLLFRHFNALPIDVAANNGFGTHTISTHQHNGHNGAESDGYTAAFFFPGQFYDYHWPMLLAGHDSINTNASEPRAARPNDDGTSTRVRGDWREGMSTNWFHDHMLDFTAQNVYKGNAAMMNIYSVVDRGREEALGTNCHYKNPSSNINLCLPSGSGLQWGNRDYDVNLLIADKAWDANGQLVFNILNKDGFLGDRVLVNWAYKPYLEVRPRRYRFRILNGSVSRYFKIAIVNDAGQRIPYYMIANDGNVMEHAVPFPNAQSQDLPSLAISERYDIVLDFKGLAAGTKLYMINLMEHRTGAGVSQAISLTNIVNGSYNGDPAVGKIMEFRVTAPLAGSTDYSMNPADYVDGKLTMVPQPTFTSAELSSARQRTFTFGKSFGSDNKPWTIKTDGGQGFSMDPHRISAAPSKGSAEIWHLTTESTSWDHPVHIHFEEAKILKRGGMAPPLWEAGARKDVFRLGPLSDSTSSVDVAIRFREFMGSYMEHCHNTQHEDNAMLLRWDIQNPGSTVAIPTPVQTWEGTLYEPSFTLSSGYWH